MIKRLFLALSLVISLTMVAQESEGVWTSHANVSSANITNCIDNGDYIYSLISNTVFKFDKATSTFTAMREAQGMSDTKVVQIYQNYAKRQVVVAYDNANIDVIDANGTITNYPQIRQAVSRSAKIINDITFAGDKMVVATGFGVAIFNLANRGVEAFYKLNTNVTSAAIVGDKLWVAVAGGLYVGNAGTIYSALSQMTKPSTATGRILPVDNTHFLLYSTLVRMAAVNGTSVTLTQLVSGTPKSVQQTPDGFVVSFYSTTGYYTVDPTTYKATKNTGAEIRTTTESGNWWALDGNGLVHIVNGTAGAAVQLQGVTIDNYAFWLAYDKWGERMLLGRGGNALDNASDWKPYDNNVYRVNAYDGESWKDVTPPTPNCLASGAYEFCVSPHEPNVYFISGRSTQGVSKIVNDKCVYTYVRDNTANLLSDRRKALAFDSQNNLWLTSNRDAGKLLALRAEDQKSDTVVPSSAWVSMTPPTGMIQANFKKNKFAIGRKDTKVFCGGDNASAIVIWQNDPTTLQISQQIRFTSYNDVSGTPVKPSYVNTIKADRKGYIWLGSWSGLQKFDPSEAFNSDFRVKNCQPTDGDFTLNGANIYDVAADTLNRQWVATASNGVLLIDEDGERVLRHYDSSNSPLASDKVYQVAVNEKTNAVFMTTPEGVYEFNENGVLEDDDISKAYCYPTVVLPDFTGMVTFKQVPRDATLRVINSAGEQVATVTSTGNTALWDACDATGNRVATGNYRLANAAGDILVNLQVIK